MNKKLIAIAVAGALSVPMAAQAGDVSISGFADIFYTLTDEKTVNNEELFSVPEVEVDFSAGGVRIDIDTIGTVTDTDTTDTVTKASTDFSVLRIEQANFTHVLPNGWALVGGIFNSGLSDDVQDAPDMKFSTNNEVFKFYDSVSLVNVAGVAVAGKAGPANVTVALVNDPTAAAPNQGTAPVLIVSGHAMEGLEVEFSFVSADATDLTNINGNYTMDGLMVGLDYLTSDISDIYSFDVGYDLGNGLAVKARIDNVSPDVGAETDVTTLYVTYSLSDSLSVALQTENHDDGTTDTNLTALELIATF